MINAFDEVVAEIIRRGFHNHRRQEHSDVVSRAVWRDLLAGCTALREDFEDGTIQFWLNVPAPGARGRKMDLLVGEPSPGTKKPDISRVRICIENKTVLTAHRNRDARFDDLNQVLQSIHSARAEAVMAAIVLVGTAPKTLNVPDRVKPIARARGLSFDSHVLPRLSTGDQSLWDEFADAVSNNKANDPKQTVEKFRALPRRQPAHTHVPGYDYVLLVPMFVDNVNRPRVDRDNTLGIDVDKDYASLLDVVCRAYTARWHL
jgi:hypothetical protein